jgi:kynurenine formamidase
MTTPSNRGRWGLADDRGTLNFITAEARARGVAEAREGRVVSLAASVTAVPAAGLIPFGGAPAPAGVLQALTFAGSPSRALTDLLIVNTHHMSLTHIDALAHIPVDGEVYPGVPVADAIAGGRLVKGSTAAFAAGIATRGVLLDLAPGARLTAGHQVTADDLDAAAREAGVRIASGDALVVRAGWTVAESLGEQVPSIGPGAVQWLADHEISLYAGDIGDPPPVGPHAGLPALHLIALARLGLPLIDNAVVGELATTCAELGRHTFLLVVAAMPLAGATGLPVNPLALF